MRLFTFHIELIRLGKVLIQQFLHQQWVNIRADRALEHCYGNWSRRWKILNLNQLCSWREMSFSWLFLSKTCNMIGWLVGWLVVVFYGISTFIGYLMSNPLSYKLSVLFQAIQFSIRMQFSSIWPIDRTLSVGQRGPGSDGIERVLRIPQSSSITGISPSDCLVSYPGHLSGGAYHSAEKQ